VSSLFGSKKQEPVNKVAYEAPKVVALQPDPEELEAGVAGRRKKSRRQGISTLLSNDDGSVLG